MIIRKVAMKLKGTSAPEFTRTIEKDVLPLLCKKIESIKGISQIQNFSLPESPFHKIDAMRV